MKKEKEGQSNIETLKGWLRSYGDWKSLDRMNFGDEKKEVKMAG